MKKRIIVILIAILVVLLAAIAVLETIGSKDFVTSKPHQGYDDIDGSVESETDEIFDLETGELIGNIEDNNSNSDSSTENGSSNSVDGDDSVSSNNEKNENSSSNTDNSESSKNESHLSNLDDLVVLDKEDISDDVVFDETITEIGSPTTDSSTTDSSTTDSPKGDLFILKGVLVVDGKPLANTKLELHSKVKTATTDKNGNFSFTDVELGKHTLSVFKNDKKVAEMSFELKKGKKTSIKKSFFKKHYTFSIAESSFGIEFKVDVNEKKGTLKFSDPDVVEKPETNSSSSSGVTSSNTSSSVSSNASSNVSSNVSSNTSSNTSSNVSSNASSNVSSNVSSDTSSNVSSDTSSEVTPDDESENTSSINSNTNGEAMTGFSPWH